MSCDRHNFLRKRRCELHQIGIAAQCEVPTVDLPIYRAYTNRAPGLVSERARVLKDFHAPSSGSGGKPESIVERMQVPACAIIESAGIAVGGDQRRDIRAVQVTCTCVVVAVVQVRKLFLQFTLVSRLQCDLHLPTYPVAVDCVLDRELIDEREARDGNIPDGAGGCHAHKALDFCLAGRDSDDCLSATSARCAPTNALFL